VRGISGAGAEPLVGREFDDGDVFRAVAAAQKRVMWSLEREEV
jgi:hypothetical protein